MDKIVFHVRMVLVCHNIQIHTYNSIFHESLFSSHQLEDIPIASESFNRFMSHE